MQFSEARTSSWDRREKEKEGEIDEQFRRLSARETIIMRNLWTPITLARVRAANVLAKAVIRAETPGGVNHSQESNRVTVGVRGLLENTSDQLELALHCGAP